MPCWQAIRADNVVSFLETFSTADGAGGRDDKFNNVTGPATVGFDNDEWSDVAKCYSAFQCMKFGTYAENGSCTTPVITLPGTNMAVLTFEAAGWGDAATNILAVTASDGVTLSGDVNATLTNGAWATYTVNIVMDTPTTFTLTFTGKRGFLDNIRVASDITSVFAPTLTGSCTFWPATTEEPVKHVTVTPPLGTTVRYTTDGTDPSPTDGTEATLTTSFSVHATTTVKAIAYVNNGSTDITSSIVAETYTLGATVTGISTFNALDNGTEVRLFLPDDANARVLHAYDSKVYLRDDSGTLCFDFSPSAQSISSGLHPTPQHNQHVAGWIIGQKQTEDNLHKLVATENTNSDYLALAEPVTEADTEPTAVDDVASVNNYVGDWVTLQNVREGTGMLIVDNQFDTEHFTEVYGQSLVDVSGIVTSANTVAPVYYNGILPIVYVIDENEDFYSPDNDIENATVRLKRTLSKDYWNTFVLPFDIPSLEGDIRVYDYLVDGNTMHFSATSSMDAGKPYLVRPDNDILDPVFTDITLSAKNAQTIDYGDYSFTGIYSPREMATDQTELFLTTNGKLAYPGVSNRMKGMRAYFQVPAGALSNVFIDGDSENILTLQYLLSDNANVYDLQGRKIANPQFVNGSKIVNRQFVNRQFQKGVYIVNGRKLVIH